MLQAGATFHYSVQASHRGGFSYCRAQTLGAQAAVAAVRGSLGAALGLGSAGSVVVVHTLSCSSACGIFLDQGSNPGPLHWQADSLPIS